MSNVWRRIYTARIAPCSEDWREAIYNGVEVVDDGKLMRESWAPGAFIASEKPVPVVLSHDESKPVGHIVNRIAHGGWHIVDFVLDPSHTLACIAADRLKHGTPVSIGARSLGHDKLLAQDNVLRHTLAKLDELSILAANERPYYPDAKVTGIYEPKEKPIARKQPREPGLNPGDVVFYGDGSLVRRYFPARIKVNGTPSASRGDGMSPDLIRRIQALPDDDYNTFYDENGNEISRTRIAYR